MQHFLLVGDLGDGLGNARVHVTDEKRHLVAFDQLARLLHPGADVVRGIFHQQLHRTTENTALGVHLVDGELGPGHLILRGRGIDAGERIDHSDPKRRLAARLNDEGRSDLNESGRRGPLEDRAPVESIREWRRCHKFLPKLSPSQI